MPLNPLEPSVDDYMARLAAQIKSLPAATRNEHLREIRQHVEQLVAAHAGQPDAVPFALSQMGDPVQVGQELLCEWKKNNRTFWQTVAVVSVCQFLLSALLRFRFAGFHLLDAAHFQSWLSFYSFAVLLPSLLAGIVIGRRLPERALAAAVVTGLLADVCFKVVLVCLQPSIYASTPVNLNIDGYELLAAYVVSSLKRRDWTLRLQ